LNDVDQRRTSHAKAQEQRLRDLEERTADRPAHAAFLAALRAGPNDHSMDDLPLPRGVSSRVALALIEDLSWCRHEPTGDGYPQAYPGAYNTLRVDNARAAAARTASTRFSELRQLIAFG